VYFYGDFRVRIIRNYIPGGLQCVGVGTEARNKIDMGMIERARSVQPRRRPRPSQALRRA
jgi:hypothetical protein